jgi:hypothetical protein
LLNRENSVDISSETTSNFVHYLHDEVFVEVLPKELEMMILVDAEEPVPNQMKTLLFYLFSYLPIVVAEKLVGIDDEGCEPNVEPIVMKLT